MLKIFIFPHFSQLFDLDFYLVAFSRYSKLNY